MPAGNNVWYTDIGRFGTITIQSTKDVKIKGEVVKLSGRHLKLTVSWPGGTDPDNAAQHIPAGPEYIDLDNMLPGNLEACMTATDLETGAMWGDDWKNKLIAWMTHPLRKKTFAFKQGDPRQSRKVRQSLTVEQMEKINAAMVKAGDKPAFANVAAPAPAAVQTVKHGTRARSG